MPELELDEVKVNFPFTPYECQKEYMKKVLQCLKKKVNGVLESPTGTGKTLCLLCATLAWRQSQKDTISRRKIEEQLDGKEMFSQPSESWDATDGDQPASYSNIPKIIYASRTHTQLSQVINELKSTAYRPKVCVLGSREQLCINPDVMRQESNHIKIHMCRGKLSTRSCFYYNNVDEKSKDAKVVNTILDVEDLVKFGGTQRVCPYYLSRTLKQQAEIIFMPYNYLLDPMTRRTHDLDLNGAVVIFDEAHNVEKTCEESTSFNLTPYDLALAVGAVDRLLAEQVQQESVTEDFNVESLGPDLQLDISAIAKIKQILLELEAAIESYDVPRDKGITKPGIFIYELLQRAHLTYSSKAAVLQALEKIIGHLAGKTGIFHNTSGLQKVSNIIQLVFAGDPSDEKLEKLKQKNTTHFKVHIHQDDGYQRRKQAADPWAASSTSKKQGNILSYWCFSPGFSMMDLKNQGVRCIILTSGTLAPLSSFTSEMRIDFPVSLENGHVIERDQIFVSVIDRGPDGAQLSSVYDRRFVPENMASLGNTIANLSRVVPHGLLVFFPSFPVMEKNLEFWRENGHADRIENIKPMFVEPKGKATFTEVMDGFYSKVNDPDIKGGSFFAVCRGKASEGLDFADTFGRGVVITGLPFPPKLDPRVVLKMEYLDEMSRKKTDQIKYLTGFEWYRQQAFRAVNQAIGRVIRHKNDYGAIFLCDQRFRGSDIRAQLPSWVKPYVRLYEGFGNVVRDASQFFRVAQKLRPVVEKPRQPQGCQEGCSSDSAPSCSSSFAQEARQLDAHLPSLKRRRIGENMASICIGYESEMRKENLSRPTSLLDALERGERHHGDHAVRQTVSHWSTLSLQYDKRMEEELRGGKRKIKLVAEQVRSCGETSEEGKGGRAKSFLAEMRKSLSKVTFEDVIQALQTYKATDDLELLLKETSALTSDPRTHGLLRGFYQFVRPHHKQRFDERCRELTGDGCGFKPQHSLSKEEKQAVMLQSCKTRSVPTGGSAPSSSQLDTQLLNQGGPHLSQQGLRETQAATSAAAADGGSSLKLHASFLADVKKALGPEKSSLLFHAIRNYKKTEDYESLVGVVVGLFTERDENFGLLVRFGTFVRPQHKKQYQEMLDALIGRPASSNPVPASEEAADGTQKKISSFFSASQKKST